MPTASRLVTADELLRMAGGTSRHELLHGELRTMSPAGYRHGRVAMNIGVSLTQHVRNQGLGQVVAAETGFELASDPDHVRAPAVAFVCRKRLGELGETAGFWPGAPDLAVEVVSPTDRFADVEAKVLDWLHAGTAMVVVANPEARSLTVYRSLSDVRVLTGDTVLDGADVVPGWRLPVREAFD